MKRPEIDSKLSELERKEHVKAILKAQLQVLRELSDRAEEEGWFNAWIDLKTELLQKLKKLEA